MDNEIIEDDKNMDIEDDQKKDIINEPINLEEAANTLIQIGLQELQLPEQPQPKQPQPAQPKQPQPKQPQPKKQQPFNRNCLGHGGKQQPPLQKKKPKRRATVAIHTQLERTLTELNTKINEVNELQAKIKSMEHKMAINIEKPKFENSQNVHPLNFIENLMIYLDGNPSVKTPVEIAIDCLYGDARSWANIFKPRWENFEDFKRDFLHQYWGAAEQSMLRREIGNGTWDRNTETMSRHFMCLIAQAKWLPHQIPDEELVYEIMTHYPKYVQIAWCTSKGSTVLEALDVLKRLDDLEKQFESKKRIPLGQQFQLWRKLCPTHSQQCRYTLRAETNGQTQSTEPDVRVECVGDNVVVVN